MSRIVQMRNGLSGDGSSLAPGLNMGAAPSPQNPITGIYGSGVILFFFATKNFVVPPGCTKVRVRGWAPGGAHRSKSGTTNGGVNGGTISFGAYCSATGGQKGSTNPGLGGTATGGDINIDGSAALSLTDMPGAGAPSVMGPGGPFPRGGAGAGGEHGMTAMAQFTTANVAAAAMISDGVCIDFIGTGPGGVNGRDISGTAAAGDGFNGGGGGGTGGSSPGEGGFPGGGQGGYSGAPPSGSGAFFLKEITGLVPGTVIPVTVPFNIDAGGAGLIIVEY